MHSNHKMHDGEHPAAGASHEGHGGGKTGGGHNHHDHGGHHGHGGHGDHAAMFRSRFWVSLALSVPVVLYSEMFQMWLGFAAPQFPGSGWVVPILGTVIFAWGG